MYPFISDYMLAQKQKQQIEQFDQKDNKTSKKDYLEAFYKKRSTQKKSVIRSVKDKKKKNKNSSWCS